MAVASNSAVRYVKTADGVRIPFELRGTGPLLVYVRGWITHLGLMHADPAIEAFFGPIAEHRRLVRYDTRGNGLADRDLPDGIDLDALVADLEAVMDALPAEPVEMWGSCYGGPIAIAYVARHPGRVSRLLLDGTYARGADITSADSAGEILAILELARTQPDIVYSSLSYMTDPDPRMSHQERVNRMKRSVDPEALVPLYRHGFTVDVSDLLSEIDVPTLVVHRDGSRSVPARLGRELAADLPNARFVGLRGRAHNLWEEHPHEALEVLAEFLGVPDLASGLTEVASDGDPLASSVTIMFTDLTGSTEMTARLGDDDAQEILRAHDRIVREALARHHGEEVKHTGDGIMASFRSSRAALAAAAMIQQSAGRLRESGELPDLALSIGLNAGEPISESEDLYGLVVQVAARVCSVAGAGEVLLTSVVRDLAEGKGLRFVEAGEFDLKGIARPVPLWRFALT